MILFAILSFLVICGYVFAGEPTDRKDIQTRTMQFSYAVTVKNIPAGAERVNVWMPIPRSDANQQISGLRINTSHPYSTYVDLEYGNSVLKVAAVVNNSADISVSMNFEVTRADYRVLDNVTEGMTKPSQTAIARYLLPDRLVPIDGQIKEEAEKVIKDSMSDLEKLRAMYDYVVSSVSYDKSGTGWGRGDAIYACDVRKGNCTDFHSLLIGMARSMKIPARFVMGYPVPEGKTDGEIPGYHCWAEFYLEDFGWVPVDASEAHKFPDKRDYFFGGLDANRVLFSIGRDINIDPEADIEPLNYFIYPYVLVDGMLHDDVERHVRWEDVKR
ncbi:MAG: transglutaminase domain-containing protein [Ignavibacteria bacterium]|nr:transglutaminase domain-containing protein [Ignavibacteria bacterium]